MRPLNLDNIEAQAPGMGGDPLEPGAYPCLIAEVKDDEENERLLVRVDICAGERKGYFSDGFYKDKPWANRLPAYMFSYENDKDKLARLKGWLEIVSACNPGFDAVAAVNAGRFDMLDGKAVGAVFREEEYLNRKTREFQMGSARPYRICKLDELDVEAFKHPKPRMLDDEGKRDAWKRAGFSMAEFPDESDGDGAAPTTPAPAAAEVSDEDVPF